MIVCLDTNIIIYNIEGDVIWEPKVDHRMQELLTMSNTLATSDATRLECLVGPIRSGNAVVLSDYQTFFNSSGIQMLPVTVNVWERAAQIRAAFKFQAMDSIHLATAIEYGCGLFLTNDIQLARCTLIPVEVMK